MMSSVASRFNPRVIALVMAIAVVGFVTAQPVDHSNASWADETLNPGTSVTGATLGAPSNATNSTSNACGAVTVNWTAGSAATSYRIEAQQTLGSWTLVEDDTGNVTTFNDTTGYVGGVTHRVYSRVLGTTWQNATPAETTELLCV